MSTFEIIMAIINVAAIITVPIAAVFVGQKLQDRNQKRKDKMAIFQCLMTHRATGWAHQDTVNALNTIDIIFVDDESVRKCWADLFSKYKPNYSTQEITTAQCTGNRSKIAGNEHWRNGPHGVVDGVSGF